MLVAEQYSVVRHTSQYTDANGIRQSSSYTNYHYNDIIVVNIDASGQIVWANKIPKKQITRNDGGYHSSYVLSVVKDKLYFVFNDNPKNLVIEKEGKLKNIKIGKEAMAVIVEIDMEGNQKKKALFSARNSEAVARPKVCRQASDNVVIIFCERNKKHRFAKLSL